MAMDNPGDPARSRELTAGPSGPVRIETWLTAAGGRVEVSGAGIPQVTVAHVESLYDQTRREEAEARAAARGKPTKHQLKGGSRFAAWAAKPDLFSRKPYAARLTVAGDAAELRPSRAFLARSTFNVSAQVGERGYQLSQTGVRTAQVLRDGQPVAWLTRDPAGTTRERYREDVAWDEGAERVDVAVTHALASAYRVGADGVALSLLKGLGYAVVMVASVLTGG